MSLQNCALFHSRPLARFVLAGLFWVLSTSFSHAVGRDDSVIGNWRLTRVLDSVEIASMDESSASRLLGKVIRIRRNGTRLENYTCQPPELGAIRVEPALYLKKEGGIDNSRLKLPNPVTVFDISCATVFVKNRHQVVVTWRGYFFEAERINR